jgi:hypothetical protein
MTGLALAASAVPFNPPEAIAQTPEKCAPTFYDETNTRPESPELQQVIGRFATKDIQIKVRILKDGSTRGIEDADDARRFQIKTLEACEQEKKSTVSVIISNKPRVYHILTSGKAKDSVPNSRIKDTNDDFVKDLRDSETSYQSDVTKELTRLVPERKVPPRATEVGDKNDVAWGRIFGISAATLLTIGGIARTKRGFAVRKGYRKHQYDANDKVSMLNLTSEVVKAQISDAPKEDVRHLHEVIEEAQVISTNVTDTMKDITRLYKARRRQLWPSKFMDLSLVSTRYDVPHYGYSASSREEAVLKETVVAATNTSLHLIGRSAEYEHIKAKLPEAMRTLSNELTTFTYRISDARKDDWDTTFFDNKFDNLYKRSLSIAATMGDRKVYEPNNLIAQSLQELQEVTATLSALPARRKEVDRAFGESTGLSEAAQAISQTEKLLQNMRETYNPGCVEQYNGIEEELKSMLENAEKMAEQAHAEKDTRSFESVVATEALLSSYNEQINDIKRMTEEISDHKVHLTELEQILPHTLESLNGAKDMLLAFVFETYQRYMDSSIQDEVGDLIENIDAFVQVGLSTSKPNWLELERTATDLTIRAQELASRARKKLPRTQGNQLVRQGYDRTSTYDPTHDPLLLYSLLIGTMSVDRSGNSAPTIIHGGGSIYGGGYGGGFGDFGGGGGNF